MWAALIYLAIASPFLFMLVVYVIRRWTATGASYQFVLFPIVSVIGGRAPARRRRDELAPARVRRSCLAGVYVGALSGGPSPVDTVAPARDAR